MSYDKIALTVKHHHEQRIIKKYIKAYKDYGFGDKNVVKGKWRKHNPFNCGNSHCMLCTNPRRTWKRITLSEVKANLSYKEQVNG